MSELLTSERISEQIAELGSYAPWQATVEEETARARELPRQFDQTNRGHLEAQIRAVDAGSQEVAARQELVADVAEQGDEFLPVVYRLGVVAVFDRLKPLMKRSDSMSISILRKEDQIQPSYNPMKRATQIAEELLSLMQELESPAPIPVAMVENEYCRSCRQEYTLVAGGILATPETALTVEAPSVTTEDGGRKAVYEVPTVLKGVTEAKGFAGHQAVGFYRAEPERYSVGKTERGVVNPPIPRLVALVGDSHSYTRIDALYIGYKAKTRIASAESYEEYLKRPSSDRPGRSRRPYIRR